MSSRPSGDARRLFLGPPRPRCAGPVGATALLVAVGFGAVAYSAAIKGDTRGAFNRWRPAIADLFSGKNVYAAGLFPTPPIMAIALAPFAAVPSPLGAIAWGCVKVTLIAMAFVWLWKTSSRVVDATPHGLAFAPALLLLHPMVGDLTHGNVNLWIAFLVSIGAVAFVNNRDTLAGHAIGLATACKLTPALLIGYFALKRSPRAVAHALAGIVIWWAIAPGLVFGFERNAQLWSDWYHLMVHPYVAEGSVDTEQINQSLPALARRLTTPSLAIKPDDGRAPIEANLINLTPFAANLLIGSLVAGLLVSIAAVLARAGHDRRPEVVAHEWGIVLVLCLLLSERSWKHHFVLLAPCFVYSTIDAWRLCRDPRTRRAGGYVVAALVGAAMGMNLASKDLLAPFFGVDAPKWLLVYGVYTWSAAAILVAHGIARRTTRLTGVAPTHAHGPSSYRALAPRLARAMTATFLLGVSFAALAEEGISRPFRRAVEFIDKRVTPARATVPAAPTPSPKSDQEPAARPAATIDPPPRSPSSAEVVLDPHALDPPLILLRRCRERLASVKDYTAVLVKQEFLDGELKPVETIDAKFRSKPASIYLKWRQPDEGKELLYVEGQNDGKIVTHSVGFTKALLGAQRVNPDSPAATKEWRYQVPEIALGPTVERLIARLEFERQFHETRVELRHVKVNGRACLEVSAWHPEADNGRFSFHTQRFFVDKELTLPIRVEGHAYPATPDRKPGPLLESYTFVELRVNVGLTDVDFSVRNPAYRFSRF